MVQQKLNTMGYDVAGSINKNSLPIYIGRYLDKKTGKIKLVKRPNYIYNKYDFNATYDHALLATAYKWNQFAASVQRVVNLL